MQGFAGQLTLTLGDNKRLVAQTITNANIRPDSIIIITFVDTTNVHKDMTYILGDVANGSCVIYLTDKNHDFLTTDKINYLIFNPPVAP